MWVFCCVFCSILILLSVLAWANATLLVYICIALQCIAYCLLHSIVRIVSYRFIHSFSFHSWSWLVFFLPYLSSIFIFKANKNLFFYLIFPLSFILFGFLLFHIGQCWKMCLTIWRCCCSVCMCVYVCVRAPFHLFPQLFCIEIMHRTTAMHLDIVLYARTRILSYQKPFDRMNSSSGRSISTEKKRTVSFILLIHLFSSIQKLFNSKRLSIYLRSMLLCCYVFVFGLVLMFLNAFSHLPLYLPTSSASSLSLTHSNTFRWIIDSLTVPFVFCVFMAVREHRAILWHFAFSTFRVVEPLCGDQ